MSPKRKGKENKKERKKKTRAVRKYAKQHCEIKQMSMNTMVSIERMAACGLSR